MLASETLREPVAVTGQAQFATSPALHDRMMKAVMDGDTAHQSMIAQFLSSDALQARMLALILAKAGLWAALRETTAA